jgi:tetratricopeptide (TPR) repeat protein
MQRLALAALTALLTVTGACAPGLPKGPRAPSASVAETPVNPVPVSDEEFGPSTRQVLETGGYQQARLDLLAGVVRRQLARAVKRFDGGHLEAGMAALTGALYLLRAGEHRAAMLTDGTSALQAAATEVARAGDEGRALALYKMLETALPAGQQRSDVQAHLAALRQWTAATSNSGPMQAVSARQQAAVDRSLFEATLPALKAARQATLDWIRRALTAGNLERPITSNFERDEAIHAYRAIHAGGATLVALHLRHGDAVGAYSTIEQQDMSRIVPPVLLDPVERAAMDNDPVAWAELFQLYNAAEDLDQPQTAIDPKLARAAAWGAAVELYRTGPSSFNRAMPLATLLLDYGMAEVAPLVLAGTLGERPRARDLGLCTHLVLRAIIAEDEIGQLPAARRTFEAAAPILTAAERGKLSRKVHPSVVRLRYVMGALETRAGELSRARPHIEAVARADPNPDALSLLAAIDRQQGKTEAALTSLRQIITMARLGGDRSSETEAWLSSYEIYRTQGQSEKAKRALHSALEAALLARSLTRNTPAQARTERLLARVLEQYGDNPGARRATDRAYDASASDLTQLTATVLDASRRALARGDLQAGREAVRRALEAGLPDEDLVYVALWLKLLEQRLGLPGDGTVEEALAAVQSGRGWTAKLRAWGRGKLDDAGLLEAAKSRVERTEALFYTGMSQHAAGGGDVALRTLRDVASSEAIELVEVAIARDLLAQLEHELKLELPSQVAIP